MKILAIDPGPVNSAYVVWSGDTWVDAAIVENKALRAILLAADYDVAAIEMVACYGMAVGKEVFETCVHIGRFVQCFVMARNGGEELLTRNVQPGKLPTNFFNNSFVFVYRREVKMHFCNSMKAKDANIRQAILDRFGGKQVAIGLKATPGPLYGIKSHLWSALAIALFIQDQNK